MRRQCIHGLERRGPIAPSSMEAEYYALVSACQEGRRIQSLLSEIFGEDCEVDFANR